MKRNVSYLVMSLLFFNVLFIFYYYFKIVNFSYADLFGFSKLLNGILVNLYVLVLDIISILFYKICKIWKLSYFKTVILGFIIGNIASFILLGFNKYEFKDYLSIISYFMINTIFIFYSLYFEEEKIASFE